VCTQAWHRTAGSGRRQQLTLCCLLLPMPGGVGAGALTIATTHHSLMTSLKFEDPQVGKALLVWCVGVGEPCGCAAPRNASHPTPDQPLHLLAKHASDPPCHVLRRPEPATLWLPALPLHPSMRSALLAANLTTAPFCTHVRRPGPL